MKNIKTMFRSIFGNLHTNFGCLCSNVGRLPNISLTNIRLANIKLILSFVFLCIFFLGKASNVKVETIYFDIAKYEIKASEKEKITKLSKANQIYLVGHTDSDGDNDYNKSLSKNRVNEVFKLLVKNGLSKDKIDLAYYGEEKPLNQNLSHTEKAQNRRVEIKYIIDPLMDFEVEKQFFDINDNAETIIKGKDGTEIIIPANTFSEKNVKLELREFYSTLDILSSNLSTKANGEILETSGMIFLEAKANGKKIVPNNEFTIKFKKMSESQDFQLFEGNRSKADLDMNWNLLGANLREKEIARDKFNRPMSHFEVTNELGLLLNKGQFSWYSYDENNKFYKESAPWKNWGQVFDYTDFYEEKTHQCFENTSLSIQLDSMGKLKKMESSFKNANHFCEQFYQEILTDNIITNDLTGESYMTIKFEMNFSTLDSIAAFTKLKNERLIAEWQATQDSINEYQKKQRAKLVERYKAKYELNNIVVNTSKLGWINCDRFINYKNKTDYIVKVSDDMNVRMIVNRYNSFFNSYRSNENEMSFSNIPVGEKVTLICTAYKDDKILLAIEETIVSKKAFSDFNFEVVSKEELKVRMERI